MEEIKLGLEALPEVIAATAFVGMGIAAIVHVGGGSLLGAAEIYESRKRDYYAQQHGFNVEYQQTQKPTMRAALRDYTRFLREFVKTGGEVNASNYNFAPVR